MRSSSALRLVLASGRRSAARGSAGISRKTPLASGTMRVFRMGGMLSSGLPAASTQMMRSRPVDLLEHLDFSPHPRAFLRLRRADDNKRSRSRQRLSNAVGKRMRSRKLVLVPKAFAQFGGAADFVFLCVECVFVMCGGPDRRVFGMQDCFLMRDFSIRVCFWKCTCGVRSCFRRRICSRNKPW